MRRLTFGPMAYWHHPLEMLEAFAVTVSFVLSVILRVLGAAAQQVRELRWFGP